MKKWQFTYLKILLWFAQIKWIRNIKIEFAKGLGFSIASAAVSFGINDLTDGFEEKWNDEVQDIQEKDIKQKQEAGDLIGNGPILTNKPR